MKKKLMVSATSLLAVCVMALQCGCGSDGGSGAAKGGGYKTKEKAAMAIFDAQYKGATAEKLINLVPEDYIEYCADEYHLTKNQVKSKLSEIYTGRTSGRKVSGEKITDTHELTDQYGRLNSFLEERGIDKSEKYYSVNVEFKVDSDDWDEEYLVFEVDGKWYSRLAMSWIDNGLEKS